MINELDVWFLSRLFGGTLLANITTVLTVFLSRLFGGTHDGLLEQQELKLSKPPIRRNTAF